MSYSVQKAGEEHGNEGRDCDSKENEAFK